MVVSVHCLDRWSQDTRVETMLDGSPPTCGPHAKFDLPYPKSSEPLSSAPKGPQWAANRLAWMAWLKPPRFVWYSCVLGVSDDGASLIKDQTHRSEANVSECGKILYGFPPIWAVEVPKIIEVSLTRFGLVADEMPAPADARSSFPHILSTFPEKMKHCHNEGQKKRSPSIPCIRHWKSKLLSCFENFSTFQNFYVQSLIFRLLAKRLSYTNTSISEHGVAIAINTF